MHRPLTIAALAIAVLAISSSALLVQYADAHPVAIAWWRTAGGAVILGGFAMFRTKLARSSRQPDSNQQPPARPPGHWRLLIVAGVALGVHFSTWLASLEMTSVAASVTLVTTTPLMIAVYMGFTGTTPGRRTWFAIGLALLGTVIISGADASVGGQVLAGDMLALIGAVMMATYLTAGERLRATMPTSVYAGSAYAIAAISLTPVIVGFDLDLFGYDRTTWLAIGAMIIGPQLAGHTVLNLLLKELGPVTVSLALPTEPVGAGVLVAIFLGQLPPLAAIIGAPLVIAGVTLHLSASNARLPSNRPVGLTDPSSDSEHAVT